MVMDQKAQAVQKILPKLVKSHQKKEKDNLMILEKPHREIGEAFFIDL